MNGFTSEVISPFDDNLTLKTCRVSQAALLASTSTTRSRDNIDNELTHLGSHHVLIHLPALGV
jgi:hypothetical protein